VHLTIPLATENRARPDPGRTSVRRRVDPKARRTASSGVLE
jgi:hypothetical protein